MTAKSKVLVLTVLLGILALPALADHGPGGPGHPGIGDNALINPRFLSRYLDLSTSQITQLQGFLKTLQTALQAVQTARPALCQQLRTDAGASNPDPTTVGRDFLALVGNQEKVKAALTAFDASFSAILTPDQLTKYDHLKQAVGLGGGTSVDLFPACPPSSSSSS
jgi:hypothetical protein